jgi:AIPR protein
MSSSELVLLNQILKDRQNSRNSPIPEDKAFEIFACEQVLRKYDLSLEEIEEGVVGGGNDGAIDGVYVFLDDRLLTEDTEVLEDDFQAGKVVRGTLLSLHLIQAKREESFTETALDLVSSSTERLLDLSSEQDELLQLYSEEVVGRIGLFRAVLQRLATRHLEIQVCFSYVSKGKTSDINTKVRRKAADLERLFGDKLPAIGQVQFLGARELWDASSSVRSYTLELDYQENATSGNSHVALVTLKNYLTFLTDTDGTLRKHIFDWNVRDYQGEVEVNREIRSSLNDPESPEFWWLNNGVTILCSETKIIGKKYILDDVQIVNGLQTSHALFLSLKGVENDAPVLSRAVLVRILVTDDPKTRDAVIRATNRQTTVPAASLRATDEVQRQIEAFFFAKGWFYDRRKSYYQNVGKSADRIVSIPLLAQAVMAMGLSRPDDSRARPSSLLKKDAEYARLFSLDIPLVVYLWLARAQREVDSFLLTSIAATTPAERTNLRFHLSMMATAHAFGGRVYAPDQLKKLTEAEVSLVPNLLGHLEELRKEFAQYISRTGDSMDKAAKSSEFVKHLLSILQVQIAEADLDVK